MDWVSTKMTLPVEGKSVLFVVKGASECDMGRFLYGEWFSDRTDGYDEPYKYKAHEVTHWMPLPAVPQTRKKRK